jgi:hypothetical protein
MDRREKYYCECNECFERHRKREIERKIERGCIDGGVGRGRLDCDCVGGWVLFYVHKHVHKKERRKENERTNERNYNRIA